MILLSATKSLSFMIKGIYKYNLFGHEVWITTTTISLMVVVVAILIFGVFARRALMKADDNIGAFQNFLEYAYELLETMAGGILGENSYRFINYIGTIFLFILISNLSGLLGLRNPTGDYAVTFLLGMVTFFIVHYQGFKNRRLKHITVLFEPTPLLAPLNIIGELANPLSISLRLFANVLSGVIMMGLWYSMMPLWAKIGVPAFLHVYTDVFSGCIQTYVFCMLTMVYIDDKLS